MPSLLSPEEVARYHDDGLIFMRGLFDAEETDLLRRAMEEDPAIRDHSLCAPIRRAVRREYRSGTAPATASMGSQHARRGWWIRPRR